MPITLTASRVKPVFAGSLYAPTEEPRKLLEAAAKYGWSTEAWAGKANLFTLSSGREPGVCQLLVSRKYVRPWDKNLFYTVEFVTQANTSTTLTFPALVLTDVQTLYSDDDDSPSDSCACLVTLMDKRRLFQMSVINTAYNLEAAAPPSLTLDAAARFHQSTLNAGVKWTWQTMLDNIWAMLPSGAVPGVSPTLPYTPDSYPRDMIFLGQSAWDAYNAVLDKVNCVLIYNPITGVFTIDRLGTTQADLTLVLGAYRTSLLADSSPLACNAGNLPASFKVHFPKKYKHCGNEHETNSNGTNWLTTPNHVETIVTGLTGPLANTTLPLWDDMSAIIAADGSVANTAALTARATEVANEYRNRLNYPEGNQSRKRNYTGLISLMPGSEIEQVAWGDVGQGMVTLLTKRKVTTYLSEKNYGGGSVVPYQSFSSQDIATRTYPVYPRLTQFVSIASADPNDDGSFDASVSRLDPEALTWSSGEAAWVYPSSDDLILESGKQYIGRLVGTHDSGGVIRPLYIVSIFSEVLRGVLYTALSAGGSATVDIWGIDRITSVDGPTGEQKTCYDWLLPSGTVALAGLRVFITYIPRDGRWYVTEIRCG